MQNSLNSLIYSGVGNIYVYTGSDNMQICVLQIKLRSDIADNLVGLKSDCIMCILIFKPKNNT